ncbi:DUF4179 domain-containing protein [Paenibacillus sp. PDC88]|uniref:DUF4179 domain-containing protein n=1 Tax=Paenibacillus sp. PDC88 TaxID=1884375 RepID=UPI00089D6410|nr:DUF4179 domain-containing protein [Paenibacillus sp. PDC88]SDX76191.1 protein of unknown function [Paenibacillus sp. PDC88]
MSCLKPHQMEDKVIRGLTLTDKEHLSRCEHCSTLYESILHEQQDWNSRLYSARASEEFTTNIMNALEDVEVEPAGSIEEKNMTWFRRTNIKKWVSAAAVIVILAWGSYFALQQPLVQQQLGIKQEQPDSWWATPMELVGYGIFKKYGELAHYPKIEAESNGITVSVEEVLADATQILIALEITKDKDVNYSPHLGWEMNMEDYFRVTNSEGKDIGIVDNNKSRGMNEYKFVRIPLDTSNISDTIQITSTLNKLQASDANGEPIFLEGDWSFEFDIDMRKAMQQAVITELHESYQMPDGTKVRAEQLTRTPNGYRIDFVTEQASADVSEENPLYSGDEETLLYFDLANVTAGDNYERYVYFNDDDNRMTIRYRDDKELHWSLYFNAEQDMVDKPFVFHFKGYSQLASTKGEITFRPRALLSKPAVFKDQGDQFTFTSMTVSDDPGGEDEKVGILSLTAELKNNFAKDKWVMTDKNGQEYQVEYRGAMDMDTKELSGFKFIMRGMSELPEEVTLKRVTTDKTVDDMNWKLELPGVKEVPWELIDWEKEELKYRMNLVSE